MSAQILYQGSNTRKSTMIDTKMNIFWHMFMDLEDLKTAIKIIPLIECENKELRVFRVAKMTQFSAIV